MFSPPNRDLPCFCLSGHTRCSLAYSLRGYRGRPCPSPGYPRYLPLSRICRVATCQAGPGWPDLSGGHMPGWPRLARGGSGAPKWGLKTWFCRGMVSKLEIMGFPATQMDCMVPRRPLGKPVSPQTPLKNGSPRLFPISGNLGKVPLSPLCISYGPFVGL